MSAESSARIIQLLAKAGDLKRRSAAAVAHEEAMSRQAALIAQEAVARAQGAAAIEARLTPLERLTRELAQRPVPVARLAERGPPGPKGDKGERGPEGPIGPMPRHQRDGMRIRFEKSPDVWGEWIDLAVINVFGGGSSTSTGGGGAPANDAVVLVTAEYTVQDTDRVIVADATAAGFSVHLPTIDATNDGRPLTVKKWNLTGGLVTLDADGGTLVDGEATAVLRGRKRPSWELVASLALGSWVIR